MNTSHESLSDADTSSEWSFEHISLSSIQNRAKDSTGMPHGAALKVPPSLPQVTVEATISRKILSKPSIDSDLPSQVASGSRTAASSPEPKSMSASIVSEGGGSIEKYAMSPPGLEEGIPLRSLTVPPWHYRARRDKEKSEKVESSASCPITDPNWNCVGSADERLDLGFLF